MIRESPAAQARPQIETRREDMRRIETYRMLGAEHEADLAREAKRRHQASLVQLKDRRPRPASIARLPPSALTRHSLTSTLIASLKTKKDLQNRCFCASAAQPGAAAQFWSSTRCGR